jgi:hypothetical protein
MMDTQAQVRNFFKFNINAAVACGEDKEKILAWMDEWYSKTTERQAERNAYLPHDYIHSTIANVMRDGGNGVFTAH